MLLLRFDVTVSDASLFVMVCVCGDCDHLGLTGLQCALWSVAALLCCLIGGEVFVGGDLFLLCMW